MTRAVDTNVVLRYLTNDDPAQERIAREVLQSGFVLTATVLMESEWVLRAAYRWPRDRIATAFVALVDLPTALSIPDGIGWAIERFAKGADFADMIHIVTATGSSAFATFDGAIAANAGEASPLPVETLR